MFTLEVESEFSAAHQLREYQGKCENLHGHNWRVRLAVCGSELDGCGMLMDFSILKKLLQEVLDQLDHCFLNETKPFDTLNPTSEHLAQHISQQIAPRLKDGVTVEAVTVWESERCRATYRNTKPL